MPRQLRHGTGSVSWLQTNPAGHLAMTFERLVTLPTRYFGEPPYDHDVAVRYLVCAAPLLMLRWRRDLVLWAVWAVAVVALPTAVDLVRSMKFLNWIRFTLAASPGMYALVAGAYVTGRSWLWQLVPAGLAVVCLQSLPQAYDRPPFEWRRTAEYVDQHAAAADLVVLCDVGDSPYQARALMVGLQHYMQTPLRPTVLLEGSPSAELAEQCAGFPVVWVLRTQSARIPDALAGRFDIAHVRDFQGVGRLYRLVPNGR